MRYALNNIPSKDIDEVWSEAGPILQRALDHMGRYTLESIYEAIIEHGMQLWLITNEQEIKAVVVTSVVDYPLKKVLDITFVAGDGAKEWIEFIAAFESIAKEKGCSEIDCSGRKGWGKLLPDYEEMFVGFRRKLEVH